MTRDLAIEKHWGRGDVYATIVAALERSSKSLATLTIEDLAPVDQVHARGLPATIELADQLPVKAEHHLLDIGCGLGGPARYFAHRFQCQVSGIDITKPFVDAARKLTTLLHMDDRVSIEQGDAMRLAFATGTFDGAYALHVTMNIADRAAFVAEAARVLKPGAFFALTEHGLGEGGEPYYPVPWSEDGTGSHLVPPEETRRLLAAAGFTNIAIEEVGPKYLEAYRRVIDLAARGALPPLGLHLLQGDTAPQKTRNAARNIEEGRTRPVSVLCRRR
jgi:SAM-dependent methyltransferase